MNQTFITNSKYLIHEPQEFEGNYDFTGRIIMSRQFCEYYGLAAGELAALAVARVRLMERADYKQVFRFEGTEEWAQQEFYVLSGFQKGSKPQDYVGGEEEFYVSVVLSSER